MATPTARSRQMQKLARQALKVEGIEEVKKNLSKIMDAVIGREAKEVYFKAGTILRDNARRNASYDPKRKEGTHLRDAIFCDWGAPNRPSVLVGVRVGTWWKSARAKNPTGAPHAWMVEYGTPRWSGKPYFRPAVAQSGPAIKETISSGLKEIIERRAA